MGIDSTSERRLGLASGAALVVSSMIGTGIYTTSGFLIRDLGSARLVLLAWAVGGLVSCCGALAYGRLSAALPYNGGEYQLLGRLYHPTVGFVAGLVSVVAGFVAPLAAAAVAFASYLGRYTAAVPHEILALSLIAVITAVHLRDATASSRFQIGATLLQLLLMLLLIVGGLAAGDLGRCTQPPLHHASTWHSPMFAHALIYVTFAYSGWNAAVYVAGEIDNPRRNLPWALVGATSLVTLLYVGVNVVYLAAAPMAELSGSVDIGAVAAQRLFGPRAALAMTALVCVGLASCVSALTYTGARVLAVMAQDSLRLSFLAPKPGSLVPVRVTLFQAGIAGVLVLTSGFDALLTYIGLTLSLITLLALLGVFRLHKLPNAPKPSIVTKLAALLASGSVVWIIAASSLADPAPAVLSAATVLVAWAGYRWFEPATVAHRPIAEPE